MTLIPRIGDHKNDVVLFSLVLDVGLYADFDGLLECLDMKAALACQRRIETRAFLAV